MAAADEFGTKDMLLLLNQKLDELLEKMNTKADQSEIVKLRERMHKVEGGQMMMTSLIDTVSEIRTLYKEMLVRVNTVENEQMTERAVDEAITKRAEKMQNTIWKAAGLVGTFITVDIIVAIQGGGS